MKTTSLAILKHILKDNHLDSSVSLQKWSQFQSQREWLVVQNKNHILQVGNGVPLEHVSRFTLWDTCWDLKWSHGAKYLSGFPCFLERLSKNV